MRRLFRGRPPAGRARAQGDRQIMPNDKTKPGSYLPRLGSRNSLLRKRRRSKWLRSALTRLFSFERSSQVSISPRFIFTSREDIVPSAFGYPRRIP
jgi:hypothetical protein